jgi:hypothetical protein
MSTGCLADVATCGLYLGIFAHRYGYIPESGNPDADLGAMARELLSLDLLASDRHEIERLIAITSPEDPAGVST